MATNLQRALSTMEAPKVSVSEIRGKNYQAQAQRPVQVNQTNYGQQVSGLMDSLTQAYGNAVEANWKEAKDNTAEAESRNITVDTLLAEKAKAEGETLIGRAKQFIQEGLDIDPSRYTRIYAGRKNLTAKLNETDQQFEAKVRAGDFKTVDEMREARRQTMQSVVKESAVEVGLDPSNHLFLQDFDELNSRNENSLVLQQVNMDDMNLRALNKRNLTSQSDLLLQAGEKSGQVDIVAIRAIADKALADGTLNPEEHRQFLGQQAATLADRGRPAELAKFLDLDMDLGDGTKVRYGDSIDPILRDQLRLQADNQREENDKKLFAANQEAKTKVEVLMARGDYAGAIALAKKQQQANDSGQYSGRVTRSYREWAGVVGAVQVKAAQEQERQRVKLAAKQKDNDQTNHMVDIFNRRLNGEIISTDSADYGYSAKISTAAQTVVIDSIMNNQELDDATKLAQVSRFAQILPDKSAVRKAVSAQFQEGLNKMNNITTSLQLDKNFAVPDMPAEVQSMFTVYDNNPAALQAMVQPEQFNQIATMAAQVKALGWDLSNKTMANPMQYSKDEATNRENVIRNTTNTRGLGGPEAAAFKAHFDAHQAMTRKATDSGLKDSAKYATAELDKQFTSLDDNNAIRLPNQALIADGKPETIPVVAKEVDNLVTELKKGGEPFVSVRHNQETNSLEFLSPMSGTVLKTTTPAEIMEGKRQAEIQKKKEAVEKKRKEEADKQAEADKATMRAKAMAQSLGGYRNQKMQ